jgi:hypothetical protein
MQDPSPPSWYPTPIGRKSSPLPPIQRLQQLMSVQMPPIDEPSTNLDSSASAGCEPKWLNNSARASQRMGVVSRARIVRIRHTVFIIQQWQRRWTVSSGGRVRREFFWDYNVSIFVCPTSDLTEQLQVPCRVGCQ